MRERPRRKAGPLASEDCGLALSHRLTDIGGVASKELSILCSNRSSSCCLRESYQKVLDILQRGLDMAFREATRGRICKHAIRNILALVSWGNTPQGCKRDALAGKVPSVDVAM